MGDTPPQANSVDMASTTIDESTSGQSDTYSGKGTAAEPDAEISPPSPTSNKSSGDGKAANGISTSEASESVNRDEARKPTDAIEGGVKLGAENEPKKKKKKSKSKKKGAAARKNVTGFEEFYADAPMTPAEAAEEKKLVYASSRAFPDRIEECIQRYRASRRMDSERTTMFNKYLWLGGIDASPRQFTGFADDQEALAEADAGEVRQMTATDFVGGSGSRFYDPLEPEHWFVDFEGIVKGFLSRVIPRIYMYDEIANRMAADLVKNFLNYVLMHDACPEYEDNIRAARRICDIAPAELRLMHDLIHELPGTFNTTATSLFCEGEIKKCDEDEIYGKLVTFRVTVLSSPLDEKIKEKLMSSEDPTTIRVVDTKEETYQVVNIIRPSKRDILMVEEQLKQAGHPGKGKPAGVIKLKPSVIDLGFDNVPRSDEFQPKCAELEEYLLEGNLLAKFEEGVKFKAVVCELNIGLRFIKEVKDVRASFDLFLPQMLMENWKDPVPNERPPPSASNPNADEALAADVQTNQGRDAGLDGPVGEVNGGIETQVGV
ncbi:Argonaute siRNA chaperone complex subunit Arb1-domain-containing protein [Hypoxylon sp. NC0597]|nr:Argonaute siRNA chaperone complex subunit Arb1-domain-containing protein [Hypoxylon sp. NC0597]